MCGHAYADQRPPGGHRIGNGRGSWQQERHRPGPEGSHELSCRFGDVSHQQVKHGVRRDRSGNVDDDRIPGGALLRCEDAGNSGGIQSIGPQAVNRLGGQRNQAAAAKYLRRLPDRPTGLGGIQMVWVHGEAESLHSAIFAASPATLPGSLAYTHRPYTQKSW